MQKEEALEGLQDLLAVLHVEAEIVGYVRQGDCYLEG